MMKLLNIIIAWPVCIFISNNAFASSPAILSGTIDGRNGLKYYLCQVDDVTREDNGAIGIIKSDADFMHTLCYTRANLNRGIGIDGALHYQELFFPPEGDIKSIQVRSTSDLMKEALDARIESYNMPISANLPVQYIGMDASGSSRDINSGNGRYSGLLCRANNQSRTLGYISVSTDNNYYCFTMGYINVNEEWRESNYDVLLFNKQNMPHTSHLSRSSALGSEDFPTVISHIPKNIYLNMPVDSVVASLNTIPSPSGITYSISDVYQSTSIVGQDGPPYRIIDEFDSAFTIQSNGDILLVDNSIISGDAIVNLTIKVDVHYRTDTYERDVHLSFGKAAGNVAQGPEPTTHDLHLASRYFQNLVALMDLPDQDAKYYGYSTPPDNIMLGFKHNEANRIYTLGRLALVSGWNDNGAGFSYGQTFSVGGYVLAHQLFDSGFTKVVNLNRSQIDAGKQYQVAIVPEYILESFYPFNSHYPVRGPIPDNIYQEFVARINTDGPLPGLSGDPYMEMEMAVYSGLESYVYYALTHYVSLMDDGFSRPAQLGRVIAWEHWPYKFINSSSGTISDEQARKVFFYAVKNGFIHPYTFLPIDNRSLSKSDATWNNITQFPIPLLKARVNHPAPAPYHISLFQVIGSLLLGAALEGGSAEIPVFDENVATTEIYSGESESLGGTEDNQPIVKGSNSKYYRLSTYKGGSVFKGREVSVEGEGYSVTGDGRFIDIKLDVADIPKSSLKILKTLENTNNPRMLLSDKIDAISRYELDLPENSSIRSNHTYSAGNIDAIKVKTKYYRVQWDSSNQTYRLSDGNPTSYKPPVAFDATEGWSFHNNVGLKGGAPTNYHGIENGVDRPYNQLDPTNPSDWKILDDDGFTDNGVIDDVLMDEEGEEAPNIEKTIPTRFKQTPYETVNNLVTRAKAGDATAANTEVTIWRGTTGMKAELIARNGTAGGGDNIGENAGAPTRQEAVSQAQKGGLFPEYSTDPSVTDRFSRDHYAVVIKIKVRYLTAGSGLNHESGWVAYENAPATVEYILDRTYGKPENIHTINAS